MKFSVILVKSSFADLHPSDPSFKSSNQRPRVNFINVLTRSFYVGRSQKCHKDSQVKQLFVLLESECVKAAR